MQRIVSEVPDTKPCPHEEPSRHFGYNPLHYRLPLVLQVAEVVECRHQVPGLWQRRQRHDEGEGWLESSHEPIIGCQELTSLALG